MPITNTTSLAGPFLPNGTTTIFPFAFNAAQPSDVSVFDGDGAVVSPALYTVSLYEGDGGTVTFAAAPPAAEYPKLWIALTPSFAQDADFTNAGPTYDPVQLTIALDAISTRIVALNGMAGRALKAPIGEGGLTLSPIAEIEGKALAIEGGKVVGLDAVAAIQAVADEVTAAAAGSASAAAGAANAAQDIRDEAQAAAAAALATLSDVNTAGAAQIAAVAAKGTEQTALVTAAGNAAMATTAANAAAAAASASQAASTVAEQLVNLAGYVAPEMVMNVVAQFGVTFSFSQPRLAGQYANGDWWVLGPVSITSISPAGAVVDGSLSTGRTFTGRVINGAQINPGLGGNEETGIDSIQNILNETGNHLYVAERNVDPAMTGVPLTMSTGSLVKMISETNPANLSSQARPAGIEMVVLTVVDSIPSPGAIRPGVSGANKASRFTINDFDLSKLQNLAPLASSLSFEAVLDKVDRMVAAFSQQFSRNMSIKGRNNHREYGRDLANDLNTGLLSLHLNFTADQKRAILAHLGALFCDVMSRIEQAPDDLYVFGGHGGNQFRKPLVLVLRALLGSKVPAEWQAIFASYDATLGDLVTRWDNNITRVTGLDIALPRNTADGRPRSPFTQQMIGSVEWMDQPLVSRANGGSNWNLYYRDIMNESTIGGMLAVELLPGGRSNYPHPEFWRYHDTAWHRAIVGNVWKVFFDDMMNAYRPPVTATPVILDAGIKGSAVWVRYDAALDELMSPPAAGDFVVKVNGSPVTVTAASIWRQNIGLQLAADVPGSATVTVSYNPGTNFVRTIDQVAVPALVDRELNNQADKVGGPNAAYPVVRFTPGTQVSIGGAKTLAAADTRYLTLALLKLRFASLPSTDQEFFGNSAGSLPLRITFLTTGRLMILVGGTPSGILARFLTPVLPLNTDLDVLFSLDAETGYHIYINDVLQTVTPLNWEGGPGKQANLSRVANSPYVWNFSNSLTFNIGAFWLDATTRVDLTSSANRAKFTSQTSGNLDILTLGDGITGARPAQFMVGDADQWNDGSGINRGTGSRFFLTAGAVTPVSGGEWV